MCTTFSNGFRWLIFLHVYYTDQIYKSVHIYTQYSLTADESLAEDKPPLYSTDQ